MMATPRMVGCRRSRDGLLRYSRSLCMLSPKDIVASTDIFLQGDDSAGSFLQFQYLICDCAPGIPQCRMRRRATAPRICVLLGNKIPPGAS